MSEINNKSALVRMDSKPGKLAFLAIFETSIKSTPLFTIRLGNTGSKIYGRITHRVYHKTL